MGGRIWPDEDSMDGGRAKGLVDLGRRVVKGNGRGRGGGKNPPLNEWDGI